MPVRESSPRERKIVVLYGFLSDHQVNSNTGFGAPP
jgi:hypothetical protein